MIFVSDYADTAGVSGKTRSQFLGSPEGIRHVQRGGKTHARWFESQAPRQPRAIAKAKAKLEADWRKRLAESGFQDLEGADRDAPLSDRGNLHESGDENATPLIEKMEHGGAYIDWARSVLQRLNRHTTEARQARRIWERHANGESLKEIGRTPGLNFHVARDTVIAIQEKYRCPANATIRPEKIVKPLGTKTLAQLAATMLLALQGSEANPEPRSTRTQTRS